MDIFCQPTPDEMKACAGEWLFTDGGCVGPNPSPIGGTWAWTLVKDGEQIRCGSGVLTAAKVGVPVSNNVSELYAMLRAIQALPEGWKGHIVSDSFVTICRRFPASKMNGVSEALVPFARTMFRRACDTSRWVLVDGHPTLPEIEAGYGKRGKVVSVWNKWCDKECTRLSKATKKAIAEAEAICQIK